MASKQDPIGDLFAKPNPQPKSSGGIARLLLLVVIGLGLGYAYQHRGEWFKWGGDDHHEVQPDDKKQVIAKGSALLFIEETADRPKFPYLALIQADKAWADKVQSGGVIVGWYDIHASEIAKWKSAAESTGLPALLVVDPKGNVIKSKSVPTTTDAIDSFVFGGAK